MYRSDEAFARVRALSKSGATEINLYICEGFLDALRLESFGQPAVAIMGASISKDQVQILKWLSESLREKNTTITMALCLDRDEAGLKGASAGVLELLDAGLDVGFVWPSSTALGSRGIPTTEKDPDSYLANTDAVVALELLGDSIYPPGLAVLAQQFGLSAEDVLDGMSWATASESRKHRAYEKAMAQLRKVRFFEPSLARRWIGEGSVMGAAPIVEWIDYLNRRSLGSTIRSDVFLTSSKARINHARLLAYRGSRRGELACDEPRWERLDVAATAFNIVLAEHLRSNTQKPTGPFDAVWVPRTFGGTEARLKVMPRPEDLIIHQYLMNEFLSEKWDAQTIGTTQFSQFIPAVRHYREERKTITTGFSKTLSTSNNMVRDEAPLSFAYQIDMDVIEGRQPATDQGMFRPYQECWHEFMQSLKRQAAAIGHVHAIRLDVSRYYDRVRRSVVRDALYGKVQAAFETLPNDGSEFAELIGLGHSESSSAHAAQIVDRIADLIFGYPYQSPDDGRILTSDPTRGIPQGPVISAWLGTITLFPVDQVAAELMERYNADGKMRIGYARYVDDIVLLADSASRLEMLREAIDTRTRALDLTLLAKADSIPPMTSYEFSNYLNEGRMLDSSGPTWIPPIVGDGEPGWDFWTAAPSSDRQSALQLLGNLDLYRSSIKTIVDTVKTAFAATDLRATELSKGARLLWYAVAIELEDCEGNDEVETPTQVWKRFEHYWSVCTLGAGWQLAPERNGWEATHLFALEGLEKLIDHTGAQLRGLTAEEDATRQKRILTLAGVVTTDKFRQYVFLTEPSLQWQTQRRFGLLLWKAVKATGTGLGNTQDELARSLPFHEWKPFEWFHIAIERLRHSNIDDSIDPLAELVAPFAELAFKKPRGEAAQLFTYLLPDQAANNDESDEEVNINLASAALQTIIAIAPRGKVFNVLAARPKLLTLTNSDHYLFMPPLPGVSQQHLIACELSEAPTGTHLVKSFSAFGFIADESSAPNLLGSQGNGIVTLVDNWDQKVIRDLVIHRTAKLPDDAVLSVRFIPHGSTTRVSPSLSFAADLYRKIVSIVIEYRKQNPGFELVPTWPYIAEGNENDSAYLLTEGVREDELGNIAFVRDSGRSLRTIEVPIFEAHLWRAGMALTDFLGFHDDITKFKSADLDLPLDGEAINGLATYVLRAQCRKLRGTFADSTITKKRGTNPELPATIERALHILEQFPADGNAQSQLKYVLATEVETAAMRLRLQNKRTIPDATSFLSTAVGTVLARLPLAVGSSLAASGEGLDGLRRDVAGILTLARTLWSFPSNESEDQRLVSWLALRSGVVLLGVRLAIDGLSTSLRSHPDFAFNDSFDFPVEWEIPPAVNTVEDAGDSVSSDAPGFQQRRQRSDPLEALRALLGLLGHRVRLTGHAHNAISSDCVLQIKALAKRLMALEASVCDTDEFAWPFSCVTSAFLGGLQIELLEATVSLVQKLDVELGLNVTLVREQSYGFNAQTRRFTDASNRTWDFKPSMISQFPLRAKTIEEEHCDGQIRRIWTEVHDRKTGRLLSVAVLGEPFASIALSKQSEEVNAYAKFEENEAESVEQPPGGFIDKDSSTQGSSSRAPLNIGLDAASPLPGSDAAKNEETDTGAKSEEKEAESVKQHMETLHDKDSSTQGSSSRAPLNKRPDSGSLTPDTNSAKSEGADVDAKSEQEEAESVEQPPKAFHNKDSSSQSSSLRAPLNKVPGTESPPPESARAKTEAINHTRQSSSQPSMSGAQGFRRKQKNEWSRRKDARNPAHVRVAVLQWNADLSYPHPISECSPRHWPLGKKSKKSLIAKLKASGEIKYKALFEATEGPDRGFLWNINGVSLKSWAEHRRQRFLERAINTCEDFGVDLLVLPEYSVRPETVKWLKEFLAGKHVAVLAGTYMEFGDSVPNSRNSAILNLLWPIPENILFDATMKGRAQPSAGRVLQLQRLKKYRSVGLNEFIRPSSARMGPLFVPTELIKAIADQHEIDLSPNGIVQLLGSTRLPLRYFLELICSEIFLLTSPANYPQIANDYVWIRRRFGESAEKEEVLKDVENLSEHLAIFASGTNARRTITVVPAATTRTADYWIAGQAALLAAGTTTVFCNGTGSELKGGSCFIGRESWKSKDGHLGFISSITPYHGWSKGIYYNSKHDALSESDQAMVIADIDPVHMMEGKPRPQLLPIPLQLVAYLPIVETIELTTLNSSVCRTMQADLKDLDAQVEDDDLPSALHCQKSFWEAVKACGPGLDDESLKRFSKFFSDSRAVAERLRAASNDGKQQPCSPDKEGTVFSSPAFYDWLDIDLSLNEADDIPEISVPAWR